MRARAFTLTSYRSKYIRERFRFRFRHTQSKFSVSSPTKPIVSIDIRTKNMGKASVWGTDIEMLTLSHLLQTPIHLYLTDRAKWGRYSPYNVDTTLNDDVTQMSMYLWHPPAPFEVVRSIRK